jgi:hypothetical protein
VRTWIIALFLLSTVSSLAQVSYSNEFLSIGVGAKAHGMAGAVVGNVNDINAAYWNPAGLSRIKEPLQLGLMHSEWFGGVGKYDHIGIARTLSASKESVAALSMIRLGIDQIPNTLNLVGADGSIRFDNVSEFSANDYGFLLSYATRLGAAKENRAVRLGINAKIIHRLIGPFAKAWGFGLDGGLLWEKKWFNLGLTVSDLTTTFTGWTYTFTNEQKLILEKTGNILPVSTLEKKLPHVGAGFTFKNVQFNKIHGLVEIGWNAFFDGRRNTWISSESINLDPKIGMEWGYNQLVFFRAGYGNIQKILSEINVNEFERVGQLHAGIGIKLGKIKIDYALANVANLTKDINYSHIFSAVLNFGTTENK